MRDISNVIFAQHIIFRNILAYRAKYTGLQEAVAKTIPKKKKCKKAK